MFSRVSSLLLRKNHFKSNKIIKRNGAEGAVDGIFGILIGGGIVVGAVAIISIMSVYKMIFKTTYKKYTIDGKDYIKMSRNIDYDPEKIKIINGVKYIENNNNNNNNNNNSIKE